MEPRDDGHARQVPYHKAHPCPGESQLQFTYWWNRMLCWGHMPRLWRTDSRLVSMSFPPMSTVPDVGGNRPVKMDLPNRGLGVRRKGL